MKNAKVAVLNCDSYDTGMLTDKINRGMEALGGWTQWVKPGMTVLLKVNMLGPQPPESAAVTHCEFVRAMIRILKGLSCTVWVGDSAGGAIASKSLTTESLKVTGIGKVAEEEGAVVKNFDKEGVVEVKDSKGKPMHIAKPMFEADLVINLPKFKTHLATVYTGAIKNFFGCIPGLKKAAYHKAAQTAEELGAVLYEINRALRPGLNIMDGIQAMDKQGPTSGRVYAAKKILISADPLAMDAVAVDMTGLNIRDLPFFRACVDNGLGEWDISRIEVCGDYAKPPRLSGFKLPHVFLKESGRAVGLLGKVIDIYKKRPEIDVKTCQRCNLCVKSCPVQAIDEETKKIDYAQCIECMCCHELCIHNAVKLANVNPVLRFFSRPR